MSAPTPPLPRVSGGRLTWAEALAGPLVGATCLWQDLDGLHIEAAPAEPPPTSLVWAWRGETDLVRLRVDSGTVFLATVDAADAARVHGWGADDLRGRVAAYRPAGTDRGLGADFEQVIVDGLDDEVGPITFVRPARPAHLPSRPGSGSVQS
jgi:hypothetical protein